MNDPYFLRLCVQKARLGVALASLLAGIDPLVVAATTDGTIHIEEILQLALENNPELQSLALEQEAADYRISRVSSLPDPKLQVLHFVEPVETRTGPQRNVLTINQSLPWFGTLKQRENAATADSESIGYSAHARELEILRQVADTYVDYAYLYRAVELTTQNLELLKQVEPVVEERVSVGGDLNALLRLKVELAKLEDSRNGLEERMASAGILLLGLVGLPADESLGIPSWDIPGGMPVERSAVLGALREHNPELAALRKQEEGARTRAELARLGGFPDLTLGINYIQLGEAEYARVPGSGKDPWGVSLSVSVPLFREKYRSAKNEALATARAMEKESENRRNRLESRLLAELTILEDAQRRIRLYDEELIPLATQSLEISRAGYESGRTGILEIIESERSLRELQLEKWQAVASAWKSRFAISSMTGGTGEIL